MATLGHSVSTGEEHRKPTNKPLEHPKATGLSCIIQSSVTSDSCRYYVLIEIILLNSGCFLQQRALEGDQ